MRLGRAPVGRSPRDGMRPPLGRRATLQALLQRVHQVDDVTGPLLWFCDFDRLAGSLAPDQRLQRVLVFILEFRRIEMGGLGIEDVARQFDHVLRNLRMADIVEILVLVAQFVWKPQGGAEQAFPKRLDRNHMLTVGQHDAS